MLCLPASLSAQRCCTPALPSHKITGLPCLPASPQESCLLLLLAQGLEAGTAEPWGPGFQPTGGKAGGR